MRKKLSLVFLALVMLTALFSAYAISADEYDDMVIYDPLGDGAGDISSLSTTSKIELGEDGAYLRLIAEPGTYNNNQLILIVKDMETAFLEYPYLRMEYRSDSTSKIIDTTFFSSKGESWGNEHPKLENDGEWHTLVWDLNNINNPEQCVPDKSEKGISLRFKCWGSDNRTLTTSSYFDVKYVAMFKTQAAAESFDFDAYKKKDEIEYVVDEDIIKDGTQKLAEYNAECDALIETIKNTPTTVTVTGTKYYVSADGNDSNDGKSPETAWKSIRKVSISDFKPGDGVFFRRGDYFRADNYGIGLKSGVTYSAYGEGDKPVLVGSIDASDPNEWFETDVPNVYRFKTDIQNAGSVIINGGECWGIKIVKKNDADVTLDNGLVDNGRDEPFESPSVEWEGYKSLKHNLEFVSWSGMYLYCEEGNPGDVFDSIEISTNLTGASGTNIENVTIDNIKFFGYGAFGIAGGGFKNVSITNCIFGWIGGVIQTRDVRLGNAIQNWGNCDGFLIDHCWSYQIYDCCYTTQFTSDNIVDPITVKDLEFKNLVSEYANSGPEIWGGMSGATGRVTYDNVLIHDTFVRNNGYGWSHQRPTKDGNFFYGGSGADDNNWNNYKFYNNKFMICYKYGILSRYMSKNNVGFVDNTYILAEGTTFARAGSNPEDGSGVITDYPYDAETLSRLRAYGVEEDGEFYSVPADYVPEPFDYKNANDIYTTGIYSDTNEHWAKGYVKEVTYAGLFNGVSADRFAPDGAMTRAMVYTVLARFDNSNIEGGEKWYDGAVKFAIDNGITTAELARPEDNVTRGELALMMYKYLRSKDIVVSAEKIDYKDSASFKAIDGASLDEVKAALDYCAAAGLIMGDDNGNMRFDANTKRSEVAAVFARMISFVRNAEVDIDAALAKGEYIKLDAEQLSKMMTAEWGKITLTEENGSSYIRVTPRTTKGTVALDLGQWNILDTDFTEYMYVKIKYRIHAGEKQLDINLYKSNIQQWLSTVDGSRPQTTSEDTWICGMFRFCDFTVNPSSTLTYDSDRLAYYKIKPFGNDAEIAEDATFDIDSIMFFKSEPLARAYEW